MVSIGRIWLLAISDESILVDLCIKCTKANRHKPERNLSRLFKLKCDGGAGHPTYDFSLVCNGVVCPTQLLSGI